jgi:hypothetical protein
MGIPLVKDNSKDSINTSLIAIKKTLENTKGGESGGGGSDVTVVDTVEDGNMDAVTSNAVYQSLLAQFDILHPRGECYTQYPGQKNPNQLWGLYSTWEELNYAGSFFRAAGGNAEAFEASKYVSGISGTTININAHGLNVGSVLYDKENNEARYVVSVIDVNNVVVNAAFSSSNLTNVLIGQYDTFQGHFHFPVGLKGNTYGGMNPFPVAMSGTVGVQMTNDDGGSTSSIYAKNAVSDDINGTPRIGNETRPTNLTIRVWKRIK